MARARNRKPEKKRTKQHRERTRGLVPGRQGTVIYLDLGADIAADTAIRNRFRESIKAHNGTDVPLSSVFCGDVRLTEEQAIRFRAKRHTDPSERAVTLGVAFAVHKGNVYFAEVLRSFRPDQRTAFCAVYVEPVIERLGVDPAQLIITTVPSAHKADNFARDFEVMLDGRWNR